MKEKFQRVLIIGDIILDKYIEGHYTKKKAAEGISGFEEEKVHYMAGGAGNVATNIAQAHIPTTLIGIIGTDSESQRCKDILNQYAVDTSMIITDCHWKIPVKTRYMIQEQEIFCSNREEHAAIAQMTEHTILEYLVKHIEKFSSIAIVDYQKGCLTDTLVSEIIHLAHCYDKQIISDTKSNYLPPFQGSYLIKMNHIELAELAKSRCDSLEYIEKAAFKLIDRYRCDYFLTTWAEKGMVLASSSSVSLYLKNSAGISSICSIGAGDTVTAYLIIGIENRLNMEQCIILANKAAEIAVSMPMTTVISNTSLVSIFQSIQNDVIQQKRIEKRGVTLYDTNNTWN